MARFWWQGGGALRGDFREKLPETSPVSNGANGSVSKRDPPKLTPSATGVESLRDPLITLF